MAPWRASTTKSEWLPDDPTAFAPSRLWKLLCITIWGDSRNQNLPTDSAEEGVLTQDSQGYQMVGLLMRSKGRQIPCIAQVSPNIPANVRVRWPLSAGRAPFFF